MRISIFGLGYVGSVSAGCLAKLGHSVVGVDVAQAKVDLMAAGEPTVQEIGLEPLLKEALAENRLAATTDFKHAVTNSEVALICVGTPSTPSGGMQTKYLEAVITQIGEAIKEQQPEHFAVMIRSTSLPDVHQDLMKLFEETSGRKLGEGLGYVCHPEFLREGIAVEDFFNPPKVVFGPSDPATAEVCKQLYPGIEAPTFFVKPKIAAMVKYADNCFHAVKVTFGNEIGLMCKELGVDSRAVMEIFCQDTKLNISRKYLMPGLAFGGSCLPKDLRAILDMSRQTARPLPMLAGTLASNAEQINALAKRILSPERPTVGIVGLAFKQDTDDVRESPMVTLVEMLAGKGHQLRIFDSELSLATMVGANRAFALQSIPHLSDLLTNDLQAVIDDADVLVVHHAMDASAWEKVTIKDSVKIIDLSGVESLMNHPGYEGIYWD